MSPSCSLPYWRVSLMQETLFCTYLCRLVGIQVLKFKEGNSERGKRKKRWCDWCHLEWYKMLNRVCHICTHSNWLEPNHICSFQMDKMPEDKRHETSRHKDKDEFCKKCAKHPEANNFNFSKPYHYFYAVIIVINTVIRWDCLCVVFFIISAYIKIGVNTPKTNIIKTPCKHWKWQSCEFLANFHFQLHLTMKKHNRQANIIRTVLKLIISDLLQERMVCGWEFVICFSHHLCAQFRRHTIRTTTSQINCKS